MSAKASPIPQGYHSVTPMLMVRGAAKEIDFLKQAFGATEKERHISPDGLIMHATVQVGDSMIMLGEAPRWSAHEHVALPLVPDIDATHRRALRRTSAKPAIDVSVSCLARCLYWLSSGRAPMDGVDIPNVEVKRRVRGLTITACLAEHDHRIADLHGGMHDQTVWGNVPLFLRCAERLLKSISLAAPRTISMGVTL